MLISLLKCRNRENCNKHECFLHPESAFTTLDEINFLCDKRKENKFYCKMLNAGPEVFVSTKVQTCGKVLIDADDSLNGAKVKLLPGRYPLNSANPAIGSMYMCSGKLILHKATDLVYKYSVSWDKDGVINTYKAGDLIVITDNIDESRCISIWKNY